jgi:hemoglobin
MKNKMHPENSAQKILSRIARLACVFDLFLLSAALAVTFGCGTAKEKESKNEFFTSGSREADQRASQRMAKDEQIAGSGEGAGEKDGKKARSEQGETALAESKLPLYERLGGEQGIAKIVDDFMPRALQDPRVNWQRKGVERGGFSFRRNRSVTWNATPANVAQLKKHFVQFFSLTTGGPAHYEGKGMKSAHANMHITNAEFDAAVGDLKASLDKLQIANREQKELLAIVESTRPQIVGER